MYLDHCFPREVERVQKENIPLVFVGGTVEYHGAHCSYGCDSLIAEGLVNKLAEKKEIMRRAVAALNERYGAGTASVEIGDSYYNMKRVIDRAPHTVERARAAMLAMGIEPIVHPIRGGTDGAMLSHRGLPCPNLGTGCENAHSGLEFVSIDDMRRAACLIVRICEDAVAVFEP
jgi:di/tripeptidase